MADRSDSLSTAFGEDVRLYDEMRPGYPDALLDDVVALAGVEPGAQILEVGCGTGQATLPLARRGFRMLCLDISEEMVAFLEEKARGLPGVRLAVSSFEAWDPAGQTFDLVVSATAFHWIRPEVGYPKAASVLKRHGALAIFRNYHVFPSRGFFAEVQELYRRWVPEMLVEPAPEDPDGSRRVEADIEAVRRDISGSGGFGAVEVRMYPWTAEYRPEEYTKLLRTYAEHIRIEEVRKRSLFREMEELIRTRFGTVHKEHVAALWFARRT